MPLVYRVFPWLRDAGQRQPGGPLYIPPQGSGRIDNAAIYSVLYASSHAAGAIAEAFGRLPEWSPGILKGIPDLPASVRALATLCIEEQTPICNLDDARRLVALKIRPSEPVTRDYPRSRAGALRISEQAQWAGIRWWSYYDPVWASIGIWQTEEVTLENVTPLRLDHPALVEASRVIVRRILPDPKQRYSP